MKCNSVSQLLTRELLGANVIFINGAMMIKLSFRILMAQLPSNIACFSGFFCYCFIFIFRSDVLGHVLPIVGKDWAQSGVAQLFTKIKNNGYRLLYLSARAIGQARVTRDYLRSIKQGDLSLPDGPLLLNPTSLISAFHR